MPLLPCVVLPILTQDREATLGKSNAQILTMGRKGWYDFYTKQGESTATMAGAEGLYGDALAARNDRLGASRSPLRSHLRAFSNDVQSVGYALTEGGTMWIVTANRLYTDMEEAIHAVLTHSGHAPHRVVSDVAKAVESLGRVVAGTSDAKDQAKGRIAMTRLEGDFKKIVADAKRLSRHDSDAVLEFCRSTAAGVARQAGQK